MEIVVHIDADGAVADPQVAGYVAEAARRQVRRLIGDGLADPEANINITIAYAVIDGVVHVPTLPQGVSADGSDAEAAWETVAPIVTALADPTLYATDPENPDGADTNGLVNDVVSWVTALVIDDAGEDAAEQASDLRDAADLLDPPG